MRDSPTHKEQRAQNTMSDQMPFPFNNFTYFFTLFSKFFSSFHHCTCSLSVSRQYLALDGIYHPLRAAFPNNSTLRRHFTKNRTPRHTGFSPSMTSCSKEHRQGTAPKLPSPNYNSKERFLLPDLRSNFKNIVRLDALFLSITFQYAQYKKD